MLLHVLKLLLSLFYVYIYIFNDESNLVKWKFVKMFLSNKGNSIPSPCLEPEMQWHNLQNTGFQTAYCVDYLMYM